MAQRTSQEVVDVGSRLPSGTARLDLSPAMLRDGSTPTSDREVPLSQGRTVLYATRPKTPARLIRATRSQIEALYVVEFGDVAIGGETYTYWNGGVAVLETNRIFGG